LLLDLSGILIITTTILPIVMMHDCPHVAVR
jgi:hypothetical protein